MPSSLPPLPLEMGWAWPWPDSWPNHICIFFGGPYPMLITHMKIQVKPFGAIHIWRQYPRGEGGWNADKTWHGGRGFDQWWRQQKRIFCCNGNKCINRNTQPLNLSLKLIFLKTYIQKVGSNFFQNFVKNCSQRGGVCQGLTSLPSLTKADKGEGGFKKLQKYADVICEWPRIQKTITLGWSLKLT